MKLITESNMNIWNDLATPPESVLKPITGGKLGAANLSQIDPVWRYQAVTEKFGPCGIGWKYEVVEITHSEGKVGPLINVLIDFYFKQGDKWSEAIPGVGTSILRDDEALKGALTDALGVAMKSIGVAANIYLGHWDGDKYNIPSTKKSLMAEVYSLKKSLLSTKIIASESDFDTRVSKSFGAPLSELTTGKLEQVVRVLGRLLEKG